LDALSFLKNRKTAYQLCFKSPAGNEVLMDLVKFCRANRSCYHDDPRLHAVAEGRREVWLRINEHLHLTPEQLQALYDRRNILTPSTEENENA